MSSSSVVRSLKVAYGDDLRRFPVVDGKLPSLATLSSQLASAYGLTKIQLKYVDEEEDQVTVVNDADLKQAVEIASEQGKSIVRLYVYSVDGPNAAPTVVAPKPTVVEVKTDSSTAPTPKAARPESTPQASIPSPVVVPTPTTAAGSSSSSVPKPSAETVLAALKEFFGNQSVLAALPTAATLFLDTLVSTADVGQAIRFTLDAQPTLKSTALVTLGTSYLDVALPYVEAAVGPLRSFLTSIGAAGMNQIKATIQTFSLFVLPMISSIVAKLTPANLEQAWSIIQGWAADPSQPFPVHELKSIVGFGGEGSGCGFGGFGRGFFGRPHGHHGGRHGFGPFGGAPGAPFGGPTAAAGQSPQGHPFAGFGGCGRGGWRRRAAEAQAAQQNGAAPEVSGPLVDILNLVGAGATQAGSGIESLLGQFFPRQQPAPQADSSASSSSSSSVPPPLEDAPKADGTHPNIICDMCGMSPIKGLRYKCTVCHDYDLCAGCEAKNLHDATHPLLKLHAPAPQKRCGYNWQKHVHGHHGHRHGGWRGEHQQQQSSAAAGPTSTGPSMKFIRDLNISDRTPVGPNTVLIKRWLLENDGASVWPQGAKLIFTRGDRELVDGEEFPVPIANAGEQVEVSAVLKTPTIPGRYQAFFRLADSDRNTFGNRIWCDLFVVPENKQQSASAPAPASAPVEESKSTEPVAVVVPVIQLNEVVSAPLPVLVKPTIEEPKSVAPSTPAVVLVKPIIEEPAAALSSSSSASALVVEPTGKYATELALLAGMGFKNQELNTFLLDSKQGDLVAVANWLLEKMK